MENLVKIIFEILENNLTIDEKIVMIENIQSFGDFYKKESEKLEKKYPMIDFDIDFKENDITILKIIQEENFQNNLKTPLEKLFYAILWKQGDLTKIKHIIKGMKGDKVESALIFHQFGKFLSNKNEPIIDQHVLRAFTFFDKEFEKYRNISEVTVVHQDLIQSYKNWILKTFEIKENKDNKVQLYKVDRILFLLGKFIKKTTNKKHTK